MEFNLGPEIILSYKRLSYRPWYALAEFIDNSTQAYFNNRDRLDEVLKEKNEKLYVRITSGNDEGGQYLMIEDNSIGMSAEELEQAVIVGKPPKDSSGRSRYGIGMKTAACWFGNRWTIITKKLYNDTEETIHVDVEKIASGNFNLNHTRKQADANLHYTRIIIRDLNRNPVRRTVRKIKDYLRSMYRKDFKNYQLQIFFLNEYLSWDENEIFSRLIVNSDGSKERVDIDIYVSEGKKVHGWAGVMEKGSRKDAGFTLLQADRVIVGYPDSYRPEQLFGPQEGGSNDLVNQRLVGELNMEGFTVSHTKDEILFEEDERDILEAELYEKLNGLRHKALTYRKYLSDERIVSDDDSSIALNEFEKEFNSDELLDIFKNYELPPQKLLISSNIAVLDNVTKRDKPSLKANLGDELTVFIYLSENMSINDPYVIIDSVRTKESIYIIVNKVHPHWGQLKTKDSVLNFIRHCVYDAVSEWKTFHKLGKIDPDTVKNFKDKLLRVPFEMEKHGS